jgi:hypothetical protein
VNSRQNGKVTREGDAVVDQHQNFQNAILKKKARIEEINLILAQPIPAGHPTGSRRRLSEERLHLQQAVEELAREDSRLQSPDTARIPLRAGEIEYPPEFPQESRDRVEAEKIRAGRDFDSAKQSARWTSHIEELLRRYILGTFLAFAKEARTERLWPVDRMDSLCREFLRLRTIGAFYEKGYDSSGRRLRAMTSNLDGSILSEVQREFEKTPEWKQYQDALLEVAERQVVRQDRSTVKGSNSSATLSKTAINIDRLRRECGWSLNDCERWTGLDKKLIRGHIRGKGAHPKTLKMYAQAFSKELKRAVTVSELES